ncbi:GDSL esterase/lipase At5g55050-like [Nicotiana sylvestris]|uniref:GDSL esterase/lipase At5g55050-like n=1 Tax=Nicotiana sylvestris TaxID=4096 RepID=UPI00388C41AC
MAAFSSDKTKLLCSCGLIALVLLLQLNMSRSQKVTAMYVFGDSQVDVGNNDYFQTIFRANFPFNGIDYPGGKPTGRFSNVKNAADFLAENVGLPTPTPYFSNKDSLFMEGVSFTSGGAGILNSTNGTPFDICKWTESSKREKKRKIKFKRNSHVTVQVLWRRRLILCLMARGEGLSTESTQIC